MSRGTSARTHPSLGTLVVTTRNSGANGGADPFIEYTVSGLMLDAVGSGDDSFTLRMGLWGTSSSAGVFGISASFEYWDSRSQISSGPDS